MYVCKKRGPLCGCVVYVSPPALWAVHGGRLGESRREPSRRTQSQRLPVVRARAGGFRSMRSQSPCHVQALLWAPHLPSTRRAVTVLVVATYATPLPSAMSSSTPLFETIEADDPEYEQRTSAPAENINTTSRQAAANARPPPPMATNLSDAESGVFCHNSVWGVHEANYL